MLSILIPVYNQNVVQLVEDVVRQCNLLEISFQVLVFDDNSADNFKNENNALGEIFGVNYLELSTNHGRAKIRNRLAKTAGFDYMLFLDCDSKLVSDSFISDYLEYLGQDKVVYGGRVYGEVPVDSRKYLHWLYGTKVETPIGRKRMKDPFLFFQSNNFLIPSKYMIENLFEENVKGYGYEDLLFAKSLEKNGITIEHIDNPVLHNGLEDVDKFLSKNKNAIRNLKKINEEEEVLETRLIRFLKKLDRLDLKGLFKWYLKGKESTFVENLKSDRPSLRKFYLLKALWYLHE